MIGTLRNIWSIPDLRAKIIFTLWMMIFYRVGSHVPVPFVDPEELKNLFNRFDAGGVFGFVDMFTGGAFTQMSVMALGVMPYISVSIIFQILSPIIPTLQRLQREGESGRKKINQWTRIGATILAAFQAGGISVWLNQQGIVVPFMRGYPMLFTFITIISITAGCTLLMWIGERITDRGIGNGVSLLICFSIVSHYPGSVANTWSMIQLGALAPFWLFVAVGLLLATTIGIILIQEGARKIPIQHAKRVVGRGVKPAGTNYLPLKINSAGVIPVIFSGAILSMPATLLSWVGGESGGVAGSLGEWFSVQSTFNLYTALGLQKEAIYLLLKSANLHTLFFIILTVFFCFFYTAVVYNPTEIAENLKKVGAFVPGYLPGKQTADYIDMVLTRITLVGAVFLTTVALIPQILSISYHMPPGLADMTGGTGLIIVVGVTLQTMQQIESQLLMRHYEGFKTSRGGGGQRRWSSTKPAS